MSQTNYRFIRTNVAVVVAGILGLIIAVVSERRIDKLKLEVAEHAERCARLEVLLAEVSEQALSDQAALDLAEAKVESIPRLVEAGIVERLEAQRDEQEKIYEDLLQRNQQGAREVLDQILDINDQLSKELEWYVNQHKA